MTAASKPARGHAIGCASVHGCLSIMRMHACGHVCVYAGLCLEAEVADVARLVSFFFVQDADVPVCAGAAPIAFGTAQP